MSSYASEEEVWKLPEQDFTWDVTSELALYQVNNYTRYIIQVSSINFVHAHIQHMDKVGHLGAAPGPLACPSRSARPRQARGPNLTLIC